MRSGRLVTVLSTTLAVCLGCGCRAQVHANADIVANEPDDRRWEERETVAVRAASDAPDGTSRGVVGVPSARRAATGTSFFGVARDLSLRATPPRAAACRCLAVAFGRPDDARFAWEGPPRASSPDALAVAIAGDGVPCAGHPSATRASVAGVGHDGDDIVLTVETVREGTPVMRGALVPWPGPGAHLLIRTRGGGPYGQAALEAGPCRLDLP